LVLRKEELQNQTIETIYFGGGTPSLLTTNELGFLIDSVYENYNVSNNPELTLEANPDDLTITQIKDLTNTQINRLSIGIQSFFDDDLQGMKHFDNITIDLIYGIPNMSLNKWNENLQMAFSLGINHISSYALTVEPKTALDSFIKKGTYPPIDEDLALQHFNHLIEESEKQGFIQYEISNFGKPNYFSKHNTSYWLGKPYLGIGPSAHSFNVKQRSWNIANNSKYIKSIEKDELPNTTEALSIQDRYNEYIMTSLRTIWGISLHKIEQDFGEHFKTCLLNQVQKHINNELITLQNGVLQITKKGKFLADGIASDLFMI
jgi:oxygen-independent coproporphyrinogen-3 oxidase